MDFFGTEYINTLAFIKNIVVKFLVKAKVFMYSVSKKSIKIFFKSLPKAVFGELWILIPKTTRF